MLCHHQQNTTFISSHACSKGDDTGDTLELHEARTKARASSMPAHNKCNEIKNKTLHFLAVTHAAEATTQETHCSCTRHVPRRVPRPCPCTTDVMKSKTDHFSAVTHAAEATTQETHWSCTRHVPRRVTRPCPRTTSVMKSRTKHYIYQQSRMQQRRRHRRHTAGAQGTYQGACLVHARAQQV